MKKRFAVWMVLAIFLAMLSGCMAVENEAIEDDASYTLGRNPFSTEVVSVGDTVYYKSLALYNDGTDGSLKEYRYIGLSRKDSVSDTDILLYDRFNYGLNYYKDALYFVDTQYQLIRYDTITSEASSFRQDNSKAVQDALVINDALYFIEERTAKDGYQLMCYNLLSGEETLIANDVDWRRISHYRDNVMVQSADKIPLVFSAETHEQIEIGPFKKDLDVLQILDNGKVIGYSQMTFYACDLDGANQKELFCAENIYSFIITQEHIFYSTVDEHAYTQTFSYSFDENKTEKILTTTYPITGYSDSVLYCSDFAGFGYLYSIDTRTKVEEVFDYRETP